jgi:hypothetical protein
MRSATRFQSIIAAAVAGSRFLRSHRGIFPLILLCACCRPTQVSAQPVTAGLSLWLSADSGVTTGSSGAVESWLDQSGNGHDASQLVAQDQPTLVQNALNGHPVMQFNGFTDFLNLDGQVLSSQQFTIIAVASDTRQAADPTHRELFSNWSFSNSLSSVYLGTINQDPVRTRFTDQMGGDADPIHPQEGFGNLTNPATPFILSAVSGATDATIYQNTTAIADNGSALSALDLTGPYVLGEQGQAGTEQWNGGLAELLVYNTALTPAQLAQDWAYLDAKYGLVPEPSSCALAVIGALGALALRRFSARRGALSPNCSDSRRPLPE